MIGRITANFGCVHRHQHVMRVFGTEATFIYDDMGARIHRSRDPEVTPEILEFAPLPAAKGDLIPPFLDAIRRGTDFVKQTQHEFDVISVCIASDVSAAERKPVEIQYI